MSQNGMEIELSMLQYLVGSLGGRDGLLAHLFASTLIGFGGVSAFQIVADDVHGDSWRLGANIWVGTLMIGSPFVIQALVEDDLDLPIRFANLSELSHLIQKLYMIWVDIGIDQGAPRIHQKMFLSQLMPPTLINIFLLELWLEAPIDFIFQWGSISTSGAFGDKAWSPFPLVHGTRSFRQWLGCGGIVNVPILSITIAFIGRISVQIAWSVLLSLKLLIPKIDQPVRWRGFNYSQKLRLLPAKAILWILAESSGWV